MTIGEYLNWKVNLYTPVCFYELSLFVSKHLGVWVAPCLWFGATLVIAAGFVAALLLRRRKA